MSERIFVVTGLSGAGRTSALKILEDFGCEAIDNLPCSLLSNIISTKTKNKLAVGIDIRSRDFDARKVVKLLELKKKNNNISVLFFDCDTQKLINRYEESRRVHPLKLDLPMEDIINQERHWLSPLKKICDFYFDTTDISINLLRKNLRGFFQRKINLKPTVRLISFGYKNGLPREADIVFDMRFLKNPFYSKSLKHLNGKNEKVIKFVKNQEYFSFFFDNICSLIPSLLDGYKDEGKDFITIAFGCTGGVHRSVVASHLLCSFLKKKK